VARFFPGFTKKKKGRIYNYNRPKVEYKYWCSRFVRFALKFRPKPEDQCATCNTFKNMLRKYRSRAPSEDRTVQIARIMRAWAIHKMIADHGFSFRRAHVFAARQFYWDKAGGSDTFDGEPPPLRSLRESQDVPYCSAGPGSKLFVEADKGGGIKTPFLMDGFVYFKRTLLAYLYYFCDRTSGITKVYGWNESYAGSGPNRILSIAADYLSNEPCEGHRG
jgi:hypothetical protein